MAKASVAKDELAVQVESLTLLHDLALRLGGISELRPALQAILDTAVEAQGSETGMLWLHELESGALVISASRGFEEAALAPFARLMPGPTGGSAGNAFARRCRWTVEDTEADAAFAPLREAVRRAGIRSVHSTPIVTRSGELLGVFSVHHRRPGSPSPRDMQLADVCARHAADAIEGYRGIDDLKRAEKELRDLDQRKNEFLATLAHELRNPLAPLRNGLEVLRLAGGGGEMGERARAMMERQLRQMVRLVDDLLDVSRISRDKIELHREAIELGAVLRSAIETSQPIMEERGHQFDTDIPASTITLDADMTRLAQVFSNLLNNAARYTPKGGRVALAVETREGEVTVTIRDNGVGIPAEMQGRVFDIFTQVDHSIEKTQGGLGIGLSIARRLVQMHGGSIGVTSAGQGQGSEFTVRLPATIGAAASGGPPRRRILVADDNEDAAMTLSMLLEALGNEVSVAHDGQEAVDMAASFRPDAILLDIGMPKLSGYEACALIRKQPDGSRACIIALTGWGGKDDVERALAAGFDRHMVKPIDPRILEKLVQELPLPVR